MSSESAFIMYSSKDSQKAQVFAEQLRKAGARVWIDTTELKDLPADLDEEEVMETALLDASVVLILTSHNALNDQFVRNDKRFARENDKKMVLVTLEACDLSKKMRWKNLKEVKYYLDQDAAIGELLDMLKVERRTTPEGKTGQEKEKATAKANLKTPEITQKEGKETPAEVLTMLSDIKDDIEYYKFKMKEQIAKSRFYAYLGIGGALVIAIAAIFFVPELVTKVTEVQDKIQWAGGLFGGTLPTSFSVSSLNSTRDKRKRLEGVQLFEKKISRFERGILPVTKAEVIALEDDFSMYINA